MSDDRFYGAIPWGSTPQAPKLSAAGRAKVANASTLTDAILDGTGARSVYVTEDDVKAADAAEAKATADKRTAAFEAALKAEIDRAVGS